jgi:hypothetical protein
MKTKKEIVELVPTGSAKVVSVASCHECGGSLQIQYSGTTKKRALSIMCGKCMWKVITDGLENEPPWFAVLGERVVTSLKIT